MPSRRQFLRNSVIAATALPLLGCGQNQPAAETSTNEKDPQPMAESPLPYLDVIGLQLWSVRDQMAEDPELTLKTLKEIGYYQVEFGNTRTVKELK
ncbi:MAG: hypothetical protein AAGF89_16385, partial [Bacteroidota bacterium]